MKMPDDKNEKVVEMDKGAFLLRYWREQPEASFRFMLRSIPTDEREMFSELSALLERLTELLECDADGGDATTSL